MKLNSLSLRTNMIFARNESEIIERESYIVVKTMSNPTFIGEKGREIGINTKSDYFF